MADDEENVALTEAVSQLLAKQRELEERIARLEGTATPVVTTVSLPANTAVEARVGLTLVNRVGVVTLILGVAFFFKWAVDNNWIGPWSRVVLGLVAGSGALAIGELLWRKAQQVFAQGITGTGIAVVYLALYAAYGFYHLLPQSLAFLTLAAVTAAAFLLSLRYGAQAIAALGLFGGYLTPLLLDREVAHPWFFISYVVLF